MTRPWWIVAIFVTGLVLGVAGLLTTTIASLHLEREQARQLLEGVREDNIRLALWRMDASVANLVGIENGRPLSAYEALSPPPRAFQALANPPTLQDQQPGSILLPSPLLTEDPPFVRLHFTIEDDDYRTPILGSQADQAARLITSTRREQTQMSLQALRTHVAASKLAAQVHAATQQVALQTPPFEADSRSTPTGQTREWTSRAGMRQRAVVTQQISNNVYMPPEAIPSEMQAVWIDEELFLLRSVTDLRGARVQGCWLDWPELRASLLQEIQDLLPGATLHPDLQPAATQPSRRLATLPVRVDPGSIAHGRSVPRGSFMQVALGAAWLAFVVAAIAIGALLIGTVRLSERRAAFVSTVTHELRTPLTTFRLYTDLLEQGHVQDPEKQQTYLKTLRAEAERLGHLIENVLSYSRLERGNAIQLQVMTVQELLDRITPTLRQRVELAEAELQVEVTPGAAAQRLSTDPGAVERILFNLVDNACKYAVRHTTHPLQLRVDETVDALRIRLRDYGPGIAPDQARRSFSAFHTTAGATGQEGVGLGLFLARRLAEALNGTLDLAPQQNPGAEFTLSLPTESI